MRSWTFRGYGKHFCKYVRSWCLAISGLLTDAIDSSFVFELETLTITRWSRLCTSCHRSIVYTATAGFDVRCHTSTIPGPAAKITGELIKVAKRNYEILWVFRREKETHRIVPKTSFYWTLFVNYCLFEATYACADLDVHALGTSRDAWLLHRRHYQ